MAVHNTDSIASRGETQANVAIAFLVLTWIFILLRIWTRTYVIANFGWDDGTMLFAGILYTVYCTTMIVVEANGGGTHIKEVKDLVRLTKWTIIGEATYIITVMMLKISLGIFFARIVVRTWQLMTIYITVAVNVISSMASFFYVLFRCGPNLDVYVYKQLVNKCAPRGLNLFFAYQQASFTTLTDFVFIILPIFILWNACMNLRSKISVGFILSLGAAGCVCSLIRFQYVDGLTQIEDFYWNVTNVAIWSTIEPGTGIIAGCLATLRPSLKRFLVTVQSVRSSASRSAKRSHASGDAESNDHHKIPSKSRRGTDADTRPKNTQTFELKSEVNRKSESMDLFLTQTDDFEANEPWSPQQEHSLELDKRSPQATPTTWTTYSNRTIGSHGSSMTCSLERPRRSLYPDLVGRDEEKG